MDKKTKVTNIFDRIPSQLDDKTRRFKLSSIEQNARLREYEDSFVWLQDAGVALPCYNLSEPKAPLKINEQSRLFKLFMNDCGLLCAMGLENLQFDILQGNLSANMGGILENVFAEQLKSNGFSLRYLNKRTIGELDFVVQRAGKIIPIEIKSGKDYLIHSAMNKFLQNKDYNVKKGYVFSNERKVFEKNNVVYMPIYYIMFFKNN